MLVVNCLKGGAQEFYLKEIDPKIPYKDIFNKLRTRYNTPHRNLSLQSEVDSLKYDEFMARHKIRDEQ